MYGLCAIGRLPDPRVPDPAVAAVCAAAFLAMIYLSMPPWPGLPPNPKAEGHYWIVSKNLVELIACLLIATTASGHWFGLDALFFGARRRRRWARHERQLAEKYGFVDQRQVATTASRRKRSTSRPDPDSILIHEERRNDQPDPRSSAILGRENANRALGMTRRDWLNAAAAAPPWPASTSATRTWATSPGQGRDHRHRRRGLPGDDPLAQPRLPQLHRLLRHPPLAAGARRQGVLQPQAVHRGRRQEAQAVRRPRRRCSPTPTSR